jgi:superfamily I DNA/RNA helicase
VLHTEGPLLILAGAGTGKTRTIVHRIAHLVDGLKVDAAHVVGLTFTNRAADEMRERVQSYVGDAARAVTLSTFHSLGVRILREHAAKLGLPKRFAVYGTSDQLAALRTATSEISIADDRFDLKRLLWQISDWKSKSVGPAEARKRVASESGAGTRADDYAVLAADAYPKYDEVLRASGAVDYDDLLLMPVRLLDADEEARRALWKRYHYILIDEYQDTNSVQLQLARLLAGSRRNLCVVGDDDQSIYAFRGAEVGNILEFERHFDGARVIRLEQNYRSTRRILAAANALISANAGRHEKKLRTENGVGAPIEYMEFEHDALEADAIAREVGLRRYTAKQAWGQYAVLYRANTQSRPLEEAFRQRNIPYRVIGGTSFFERKEVADAVAYLRLAANPDDEIALRRIINYPTRGIGRTTVIRIAEQAREQGKSFRKTLEQVASSEIGAAGVNAIAAFVSLVNDARSQLNAAEAETAVIAPRTEQQTPISVWAQEYIERLGLADEIRKENQNAAVAQARVDNLRDLIGTLTRYERRVWDERLGRATLQVGAANQEWEAPTLAGALAWLALDEMNEEDEDERDDDSTVALMTMHSAKGLEFSDVFIVGLEEGILPHARSIEAGGGDPLAEERRLLYVGITRARNRLTLSCCRARKRAGSIVEALPSRYLKDIPADLLEVRGGETPRPPEESASLRKNFFDQMREMTRGTD